MNQKMLVGEVWVGSGGDDDDRFVFLKKMTICQLNDLTEYEYFSFDVGH